MTSHALCLAALRAALPADQGCLSRRDAGAAVALDPPFDPHEQVGPHGLRAGIAAPDATGQAGRKKQADRGEDQDAGQVVDFLGPDLDEEEIAALMVQIDQHGLVRRAGAAVPAHPGQDIVKAEQTGQGGPFDPAEAAADLAGIDLGPAGVKVQRPRRAGRGGRRLLFANRKDIRRVAEFLRRAATVPGHDLSPSARAPAGACSQIAGDRGPVYSPPPRAWT